MQGFTVGEHLPPGSAWPSRSRHSPKDSALLGLNLARLRFSPGLGNQFPVLVPLGARLGADSAMGIPNRDDGKVHQRFGDGQDRFVGSVNFHGSPSLEMAHRSTRRPVNSPVWGVYNIAAGVRLAAHPSQVQSTCPRGFGGLGPRRHDPRLQPDLCRCDGGQRRAARASDRSSGDDSRMSNGSSSRTHSFWER